MKKINIKYKIIVLTLIISFVSCTGQGNNKKIEMNNEYETAVLGAGCFWCVEAVFQQLKGVEKIEPGYSGGTVKNPSYKEVCTGRTGHAEVAHIVFDPKVISFSTILDVFFKTHDPTTLNYQGNDHGTQYRSAIFYTSEEQRKTAEDKIKKLEDEHVFKNKIVTEVTKLDTFYVAEDYHHNYYKNNPNQGYCRYVIDPKIEKFKKAFGNMLK